MILSKHSKPQPVWCALQLPLLLYSTQHLILSLASTLSCGHSPVLMRTSSWMVWAGSCQPTLLVQPKVFHSKLTEWQIWLPRKSSQVETEWGLSSTLGRCSECGSFLSSLLLRLLSEFSPYPGRAAFSGQQQAAFKIMWRSAWCFTTLIAETITLMCSSSLHIIIS